MNIDIQFEQGNSVPRIVRIRTDATLAQVTTAGWLNGAKNQGIVILPSDKVEVYYGIGGTPANAFFDVSISTAGVITLSVAESNVILPVVSGNFAVFSGTSGAIADLGYLPSDATKTRVVMAGSAVVAARIAKFADTTGTIDDTPGAATNLGDIYAGADATAGALRSYPATTATGFLGLTAVANSGAFNVIVSNVAHGQTTTHSIPDPANAVSRFLVGATATPFVSGNFPVASGTGGLMVDSGLAAANVQNKTNIKAASTADIGGGGAGPISVVVAGLTAASKIVATIASSSNVVSVAKCIATATGFDITFSGDPGAACVVNYVAFVVAQ